jgi:hypothetical protein
MTTGGTDLSVRRHERVLCDLGAMVTIAPESLGAVRPSRGATTAQGEVEARVVDASKGGLGLRTRVFLPGTALLIVRFTPPGVAAEVRAKARVQRVAMLDRTPTYYIGTAFEGEDRQCDLALGRLIQELLARGHAAPAGGGRA